MSLNYRFDKIEDKSILFADGKIPADGESADLSTATYNTIMACYNTGMSKITAENVDEFWERYQVVMRWSATPERFWGLMKEDVMNHIGLATNVSQMSPAKFKKAYNND